MSAFRKVSILAVVGAVFGFVTGLFSTTNRDTVVAGFNIGYPVLLSLKVFVVPAELLCVYIGGVAYTDSHLFTTVLAINVLLWTGFFFGVAWFFRKLTWAETVAALVLAVIVGWFSIIGFFVQLG